ncbi:MAG: polysaccharide biosynthesis protein [Zetaproteobacteria bacterium CG2_30_46_52]|nr:MAG: polysaccharide biosynthesis protein [Zetaproteobacteria bacterium CG2_30_46_52]
MSWVAFAIYLAFAFRFDFAVIPKVNLDGAYHMLWVALPAQALSYWYFGLYRGIWRFASLPDLKRILQSVLAGMLLTYGVLFVWVRLEGIPRSTFVLYPLLLVGGLAGMRLLYRWLKDKRLNFSQVEAKRTLIVGAGKAGETLLRDILQADDFLPVGFLDDSKKKLGMDIHGIRVIGDLSELPHIIKKLQIDTVLVAIPSITPAKLTKVVNQCSSLHVICKTLPSVKELQEKKPEVGSLRHIRLEDLLGREEIALDDKKVCAFIRGKKVLVTGAGGSIGSELCRQLIAYKPSQLIMLDHSEFNLYSIDAEIGVHTNSDSAVSLLGDIRDPSRMHWLFESYKPDIVFNAAAYKHVPLVEKNPVEGVKTNVLGTCMLADLASSNDVAYFVQISTDKAVNPANVMGATKRMAEIYCQNLNSRSNTSYITTRFGNVLGSAGSVVPLFRKQIEAGGPVTVTHPQITRYFMTIPEAVSLILQAATMGDGGEIFVLDMGKPIRIHDLAEQMISLAGFVSGQDIEIKYTGLRSGEKLYEELFHEAEALQGTSHPKILLSNIREVDWADVQQRLLMIRNACDERDVKALIAHLQHLVPEFTPDKRLLH